jgi:peptidoglycan hydrolase-like protein with peptidoglycan-binding domain
MTLPTQLAPNAYLPKHLKSELDLALPIASGSPRKLAKLVQERLCLAGFKLKVDGDWGPATTQQMKSFQQKSGLQQSGTYDTGEHDLLAAPFVKAVNPLAAGNQKLGSMIVAVARQHTRQHPIEVGGDNCGPWVRMYMDGNEGEEWKWCAGFSFFIIEQACNILSQPMPMNKSFAVDVIVDRAKNAGQFLSEQQARSAQGKAKIVPGSLFVVRASSSHWSHVGIVTQANKDAFGTCEGNTNDDGSANGFEAVERVRGYSAKDFVIW